MSHYPVHIEDLIQALTVLPGVGRKTAERYAFHLLRQSNSSVQHLSQLLVNAKRELKLCSTCFNYSTSARCDICEDAQRSKSIVCVVPESTSVYAIEQAGTYRGVYHVLGGVINQLSGIGPDQLRIRELVNRIQQNTISEVILALNFNAAGESTTLYVLDALKSVDVKISRLARGLPAGSDIEYADDVTLGNAIEDRKTI